MSHTPTPWIVDAHNPRCVGAPKSLAPASVCSIVAILEGGPEYADEYNAKAKANAAHIVRCVNSHDALLTAAREATSVVIAHIARAEVAGHNVDYSNYVLTGLRAAIALAEGDKP